MVRRGGIGALLTCAVALSCSSTPAVCPTIACEPTISLQLNQPIAGSYTAVIVFQATTYQVTCPSAGPISDTPPRLSCDANGITLTGIDLGHGDVDELDMNVELMTGDSSIVYPTTITLLSITNSMDCELVCYQHTGVVGN